MISTRKNALVLVAVCGLASLVSSAAQADGHGHGGILGSTDLPPVNSIPYNGTFIPVGTVPVTTTVVASAAQKGTAASQKTVSASQKATTAVSQKAASASQKAATSGQKAATAGQKAATAGQKIATSTQK